ncbi:MAG: EAL domain-containing protein [Methylococcales bacterium]|nr:EAL domain-containing protein [Methylococcales bacterium]
MDFFFGNGDFLPHAYCFAQDSLVLWVTVLANGLVALAYFMISAGLVRFVYLRKDIEFQGLFVLFSLFISACGVTHVMHVVTVWWPVYGLSAGVDVLTALVSTLSAVVLWQLIPKAVALPSPSMLVAANQRLSEEIEQHCRTQKELEHLNEELDNSIVLLKESNRALQESEQRFKHAVNVSPAAIYHLRQTGDVKFPLETLFVSDTFARISGFEPLEWYQNPQLWFERLHGEDYAGVMSASKQLCQMGKLTLEYRFLDKYGEYRWIYDKSITTPEGEVFGAWLDITEQKQAEQELKLAAITFESLQGIMITDAEATILRVNRAFSEMTGYAADEVMGQNPRLLHSDQHSDIFYEDMWRSLLTRGRYEGEIWDRRKDGSIFPVWQSITAVKNTHQQITHYVAVLTDLSEKKKFEEYISQLAFYDPLTELANRRLLLERIEQMQVQAKRRPGYGAILYMDLDRFKLLNDSLGHQAGDMLLVQVAKRLKDTLREQDTAARLGGDEFVVLLDCQSSDLREATHNTLLLSEKVMSALNAPYDIADGEQYFSASMGITLFSDRCGLDATHLLQQADTAMYRSKEQGRNCISFFDYSMQQAADQRLQMESALRVAVEQRQFLLYYQPQINGAGQVVAAEALIRWLHPEQGLVSPATFIPIAEETGLIQDLGRWVIEQACQQIKQWCQQGLMLDHVAVNVSAPQFRHKSFVEHVITTVKSAGIAPKSLLIEITESLLMHDVADSVEKMRALTAFGVCIAIDDFGTGYSSLAYLTQFPLRQLKIDQRFVSNLGSDAHNAVIVETIIAMANKLDFVVVAEGVETTAQLTFLKQLKCHLFQGFLFSRPLPVAEFQAWVTTDSDAERTSLDDA